MFYIIEKLIFACHCLVIVNLMSETAFCCVTYHGYEDVISNDRFILAGHRGPVV